MAAGVLLVLVRSRRLERRNVVRRKLISRMVLVLPPGSDLDQKDELKR